MPPIPTLTAELEQTRLQSIMSLVFEGRHYRHSCDCKQCNETRSFLAPEDRTFVDYVSKLFSSSPATPTADLDNAFS